MAARAIRRKEVITISGLYCHYLTRQEQTVVDIIGTILKLVYAVSRGDITIDLREQYREGEKQIRSELLPDLMLRLRLAISSLPKVLICIDSLDEYLPKRLPELLIH